MTRLYESMILPSDIGSSVVTEMECHWLKLI